MLLQWILYITAPSMNNLSKPECLLCSIFVSSPTNYKNQMTGLLSQAQLEVIQCKHSSQAKFGGSYINILLLCSIEIWK